MLFANRTIEVTIHEPVRAKQQMAKAVASTRVLVKILERVLDFKNTPQQLPKMNEWPTNVM